MVVIDDRNRNFVNWFMVYLFVFFLSFMIVLNIWRYLVSNYFIVGFGLWFMINYLNWLKYINDLKINWNVYI